MVHAIEVQLGANISKYQAGMDAAKRTGTESMGFIASIFDKIKSMFSGLWDSFKSLFSGFGDKSKSTFDSMSSSASSAFQKLSGYFSGFNSNLDKTNGKMSETEEKTSSLASKIGIGLVAAFVAVTAVVSAMVAKGLMVDATFAGIAASSDLAVSQISRFDAAAARSGVGIKDLGAAMAKFRDQMKSAAAGDGSDEFSKLGVKVADSNNALRKTDDVMIDVAKKIAAMSTEAEKYAAASKLGFDGKVQVLEDIAHASDLSSRTTDDQATAVVRLGKVWHEILPSGRSMWEEISDKLTNALTPAMTTASVAILEAKNRIVSAFGEIYGGGTMFDKLAGKIKSWSEDASKWFADVSKSATSMTVSLMQYIALKTGMGDPSKSGNAGYVPAAVPLNTDKHDPVAKDEQKEAQKQFDQITKAMADRTAIMKEQIKVGAALTDGQRTSLQLDGVASNINAKDLADAKAKAAALDALDKQFAASQDAKAADAAASKKEGEAYATLMATIQDKIAQDKLQLFTNGNLTESQKLLIKMDAELASGKLKLSDAHIVAAKAAIEELGATEDLVKAQAAQKDLAKYIESDTEARDKSIESLHIEYAMYGKSSDARAIAMVAIDSEALMQSRLNAQYAAQLPVSEQFIKQLEAQRDARTQVTQATLGQTQALQYAAQLAQDNKQFAVDSILDDKQRAAAQLALDSQVWQERIKNAGDGTEAQRLLQENYDTWYRNQSIKPALDEQKQMWSSIEQTAHDTFISIFDSGKSAFDRLRDALKNGLLDLLYQMTLKKWIINVQGAMGISGATTVAGAAGSAATAGGTSLIGAASNALSLYKGIGAGAMDLGGSAIAGLGGLVGSSSLSAFGAGFAGNAAGMAATAAETFGAAGMAAEASAATFGATVAAALPWVAGAVAVAALWSKAFGHGDTEVQGQGIRGTVSASSLSGTGYQQLHQDGGWFSSGRNWEKPTAFTDAMIKQFTQGMQSLEASATGFASSLGVSADWIKTYSKAFDITLTGDATKDAQAVTDFFNGVGDEIAKKLVPNLDQFSKSGETASATLQRLAGDFASTNQIAQLIGKTGAEMFGSLGIDSAAARERVIDLSGGVSTLSQQAQSYAANYLTDAQKLVPVQKALDAAMASLGLSCVQTRDQFKAVVDSLDLTTEAGAKEFASLMALSDAFAQVHPAIDATAIAAQAAADAAKAAADAMQAMKDAASGLLGDVDSSFTVLQNVTKSTTDAISARITAEKALSDAIKSTLSSMTVASTDLTDRMAAEAQIKSALAIAKAGGPLPTADSLKDALSTVSQDASNKFGSYADYLKDLYSTKNDLSQLGDLADSSLSVDQKQLDSLNQMLATAKQQVDVLKGIDTTGLSIEQALAGFQSAMARANQNPVVGATSAINGAYQQYLGRSPDAAGLQWWQNAAANGTPVSQIVSGIAGSTEATLDKLYQSVLGRAPDAQGLAFWMNAYGPTMDASETADWMKAAQQDPGYKGVPGFAAGGDFGGGWRLVGENGPELEATGPSRIFNASQTSDLFARLSSPSSNNDALVAEIKSLKQQHAEATAKNSAENVAMVKQLQAQVDLLTRVIYGGDAIQTKAAS